MFATIVLFILSLILLGVYVALVVHEHKIATAPIPAPVEPAQCGHDACTEDCGV